MERTLRRIPAYIYLITASLFLIGVLVQVYLTGLTVVSRRIGWTTHIGLGHTLGLPLLLMLFLIYLARLPRTYKALTWLLFLVYFIQADVLLFLRQEAPWVAALHPVLALVDFALALWLTVNVSGLLRRESAARVADG